MANDLVECQIQPYLKTLTTTVLSCSPTPQQTNNKKKSRSQESASNQTYDVVLESTILYPEGGGQPSDQGWLNDNIEVTHVYKNENGQIIHQSKSAVEVGEQVAMTLDWTRRYDHMQQHSSQHLISAIFIELFDCHTLSWWLASSPAECYIEFDRSEITDEQLDAVERRCNEVIRAALPLHMHTYPSAEHALADEQFTSRLPKHKILGENLVGTVRVIEIEGVDFNACGGTHVAKTSELQLICLTKTDSVKGHARVHFLAGKRASLALKDAIKFNRSMTSLLSASGDVAVDILKRLQLDHRNLVKQSTKQTRELADYVGQDLYHNWKQSRTELATANQTQLITYHREESNMLFLSAVTDRINSLVQASSDSATQPPLMFLTCSDTADSKDGQFLLIGGAPEHITKYGPEIAKTLHGKGGGKGRVQGKASRIDERTKAIEFITKQLTE